jgi:hypothetical protein
MDPGILSAVPPEPPRTGRRRISPTQWVLISMIGGIAAGCLFLDGPNAPGMTTLAEAA